MVNNESVMTLSTPFTLPPGSGKEAITLPPFRQLTLVGANGSGKTRFMNELINRCGSRAYVLSVLNAFNSDRKPNSGDSRIDTLYAEAVSRSPYLVKDRISEFDKLIFLLLNEECEYLLELKRLSLVEKKEVKPEATKLDRLVKLWEKVFPGNQILRHSGRIMFSTGSGDDKVPAMRLSHGEKTALYYISAIMYAPENAVVFIDSPSLFLHPAMLHSFWNSIEHLRPDCTFIYNTYDVDFVSSRTEGICIWVKSFNAAEYSWDYTVLKGGTLSDELVISLLGSRKPVLFTEGDATHSIDFRLYTLIFPDFTVRPLGSCNKVIESTRTFNDLTPLHHLDSRGVVDRDRRTEAEVSYLRRKKILVPEVAEIENIFLLEDVIKIMSTLRKRNPDFVFTKVKNSIMRLWSSHLSSQALMHVRHIVKRNIECKIDGRFSSIGELQQHLKDLPTILKPEELYTDMLAEFKKMLHDDDYAGVLKVFNHKPMLGDCNVASLLGYTGKDRYISDVLRVLKGDGKLASELRRAIRKCFLMT